MLDEVTFHINKLTPNKSTGVFGIPIKYVKMSTAVIAPILTQVYNDCMSMEIYPDDFK